MTGIRIAVIGGSGIYDPAVLENTRKEELNTPFGRATIVRGSIHGKEVAFMARHGENHSVPPHLVNYRANIWGLKQIGVKNIFATAAVGSLNLEMEPGQLVLVDQFLDFTRSRPQTFMEKGVLHLDMTTPYCPELRKLLAVTAKQLDLAHYHNGTYVCSEGPRFETPAEVYMFRQLGGDVVGMTGVPEVVLAKEAGMCYATIAMITNFAAGISVRRLSHQEVVSIMTENADNLRQLLIKAIVALDPERACTCRDNG